MSIEIDGSFEEGGGQILRISVALAAIVGKSIKIHNIRVKRSRPGIMPQHETAVRAVAELSQAVVKGLRLGSTELEFNPKRIINGRFLFDVGTAASTSLVLQSLMPIMAFSDGSTWVEVHGGTNNPWAPPADYLQEVLLPTLGRFGFKGSVELVRRGFYPNGGGIVKAWAEPIKRLNSLNLTEFGEIRRIHGLSYSSKLPCHIVQRMSKSANRTLMDAGFKEADIKVDCSQPANERAAPSPGCGVILLAELSTGAILGSDSLGEIGKPAEKVGQEAADSLCKQLKTGAPVGKHLGDQLIPYMALARGRSEIKVEELTLHTLSCIHIVEVILGANFEITGEKGRPTRIICDGIGLENASLPV
ncbi:MAG: RNA 3'-terminal phosphate cyclase [Candidatus Bathyarchaeota archaeon]